METFQADDHVVVQLETGDDVLASIRAACRETGLETGAVISAIGTLKRLEVHYLHSTDLGVPADERNTRISFEAAWEVSTISGVVADGEPHLHLTAFDGDRTVAGHVEPGCVVNALGEVVLRRFDDLSLERSPNEYGVDVLQSRE